MASIKKENQFAAGRSPRKQEMSILQLLLNLNRHLGKEEGNSTLALHRKTAAKEGENSPHHHRSLSARSGDHFCRPWFPTNTTINQAPPAPGS